jgi:hypothetical protein
LADDVGGDLAHPMGEAVEKAGGPPVNKAARCSANGY